MRKQLIAANWKMYKDLDEVTTFFNEIRNKLPQTQSEIMIGTAYTNLHPALECTKELPIKIMAQNTHQEEEGAFTGEISAKMLKSIGVHDVILGHSERREYFGEDDALLKAKVNTALKNEMNIIFCVGEKLEQRQANTHFELVKSQLENTLFHLAKNQWQQLVIAYEPVWAIGTGETASPKQAQEMHQFIRKTIATKYDEATAQKVSILYGGSVKPQNAQSLFSQPDIDGGLVGGASLEVDSFIAILKAM